MPEGTKVDKLYKKLRAEGKSEESAARIAQSVTGEALATGKPPKGKENMADWAKDPKTGTELNFSKTFKSKEEAVRFAEAHGLGKSAIRSRPGGFVVEKIKNSNIKDQNDNNFDEGKRWAESGSTAFQNGRMKALNAIFSNVAEGSPIFYRTSHPDQPGKTRTFLSGEARSKSAAISYAESLGKGAIVHEGYQPGKYRKPDTKVYEVK
jgi:hypothetical protein